MTDLESLRAARRAILGEIADAADRAGRAASSIEIVAITKTVPPERIQAAIAAGFATLGENRVQERQDKAQALEPPAPEAEHAAAAGDAPRWHLVGPLQSNKARRAVELFDLIQTVDSVHLAERLSRIAGELRADRPLTVLLQVNVDDDAAKSGFDPRELERDLPAILDLPGLAIDGLMTVGRLVDEPEHARPTFVALRALSERLRAQHTGLGPALSMGMSEDYPIAVEEGATLVRIGRAIFGERPTR